jgi:hypothetical protein
MKKTLLLAFLFVALAMPAFAHSHRHTARHVAHSHPIHHVHQAHPTHHGHHAAHHS